MIENAVQWLLAMLAIPDVGLISVAIVSFVSATILPMGSEPTVFAVIKVNPELFRAVILVATLGNTLGGMVDYWMGYGAEKFFHRERKSRWFGWLNRFGAKTLLLAWVPVIGDPLCVLAGWLKLPFWPSVAYMAIGKCLRYLFITGLLSAIPNSFWERVLVWIG